MKRRIAIKNIGLAAGSIVMSGAVIHVMHGCTAKSVSDWNPSFFSNEEADVVAKILEVILPKTEDIPGATELNLTQFIDSYFDEVAKDKEKSAFKAGIGEYLASLLNKTGKSNSKKISLEDIDENIAFYLKADLEKRQSWDRKVSDALKNSKQNLSADAVNYSVLKSLRSKGISAFKTNEYIAEKVMAYDPIPGMQKGCVDLNETTNGKAWSL